MTINTIKSEMSGKVYFLGAGASASGKIPIFSNPREFRNEAKNVLVTITENEGKPLVNKVLDHWEKYYNNYTIENYFVAVELDEQLGYKDTVSADDIKNFLGLIIDNIRKKPNTYEYKCLIKCGRAEAIITTNWDFLLERSITELQGIAYNEHAPINYDGIIEPYYDVIKQTDSPPPIYKLHGSLNWGYCEKCDKLYYFNRPVFKNFFSKYSNMKCHKHPNVELTPFIVPPTLSKLKTGSRTEGTPYSDSDSIRKKAYEYLKSCQKLCFIGYSFPEADMQMRFFISNALRKNSNLKEIIVVTRPKTDEESKKFEKRYHDVISGTISNPKICFYYKEFKEFCKEASWQI